MAFREDESSGRPTRVLCYSLETKTWWVEMYPQSIAGGAHVLLTNGDYRCVYGASSGAFLLDDGRLDSAVGSIATVTITSVSSGTTLTTSSANALAIGDQVSGTGIAPGTVVIATPTTTTATLSAAVTAATGTTVFVRRMPYKAIATTQGNKFDINSAYETAAYEDSIVFHQDVFTCLVPKPITAAGSNVTFDAVNYMGDFKWKNIPHATDNPDGTIGYFRAVLSAGSKPIRPEWGSIIRHRRSSTPLDLTTTASVNTIYS
ncbi:hypothetical protein EBZ80_24530 [bacterium]|nr:hypothetical protein [bacterium]